MDGIDPHLGRLGRIYTLCGGRIENNYFGTHVFMDLCEQLGCEPYICGNVGSGSVREMQQWFECLTSDGDDIMAELRRASGREKPCAIQFYGVGNENWGCGGNMRREYCADLYRRYAMYLHNFAGSKLYRIACSPNSGDYEWPPTLMEWVGRQGRSMEALSLKGGWIS